jgi:acetyl esterase
VLFGLPARMQLLLSGRSAVMRDGATLHPQMQLLLALTRQANALTSLSQPTVEKARRLMIANTTRFPDTAPEVGNVRDFTLPTQAGPLRARHYVPSARGHGPAPLLVYLHGGGFVLGNLETHDHLCRSLCQGARVHVLSVEYRKAPEYPFPAGPTDALAAFRYAQAQAGELGVDPERIAVGGDSAGANLATFVARRTRTDRPPYAQILIYPVTDRDNNTPSRQLFHRGFFLTLADIQWFDRHYAGEHPLDEPDLSPLRDPNLQGLCPSLLMTAEFDPLRDEGEAYARALTAAGNSVDFWREPGLMHGFVHSAPVSSAAQQALDRLVARTGRLLDR